MKIKIIILTSVVMLLAFLAYIQTPTASINKNHVLFYSPTDEEKEVSIDSTEIYGAPILEYKLEETKEEAGFLIEIYREYEIYKNRNGEIVKTVATDNTQSLTYAK